MEEKEDRRSEDRRHEDCYGRARESLGFGMK